jgi:hypothetical protein
MSIPRTTTGFAKPKQKVSKSEKTHEWAAASGQYYRDACQAAIDRAEALELYKLANGELDETDYLYVTNPINSRRPELQGYPARLYSYDIISPNVNLLMGEKGRRMFPPIAIAKNSDYHIKLLEEEQRLVIQEAQKMFVNEAIKLGAPLDQEEVKYKLDEIAKRIKNLPDHLTTQAQDVLEYIMDLNDLPRNFRKGFYDWLVTSMVFSYKDVYNNKTCHEIISPVYMAYLCAPRQDFIEDGDAVRVRHRLSVNDLYDRFQDDPNFDEELKDFIDQHSGVNNTNGVRDKFYQGMSDIFNPTGELWKNLFGQYPEERYADGIEVEHVMWRSFAKEGKLTRTDIFGTTITDYVDEDFIPLPSDNIEWRWVDEIWEGYCVGDRYWVGCRPVPIQRGAYNDPHSAKLLYNGRNYLARHTRARSLVKKGKAYQKSVNIIKYRAEESLAKNLDQIILFPLGLIPKKEGWDEAKLMYYIRAFGMLFFDDSRPNAAAMISALKSLNVSSVEHILRSYEMVRLVKMEWDETCGINPQRKSQIGTSAGQGVTNEAIDRSYVMSEELFMQYEEFERTDYTGMVELSKYAFVDGIQAHFIKQDGTRAFLNLHDPDSFINSDIAIFIKNGSKELQKLESLRQQTTAFAQNGATPKMISAIIEAENFSKLHEIMDEIEETMDERRQQELQVQQDVQASKERIADKSLEFQYYDKELRSYTDIQVALIDEGIQMAGQMQQMTLNGQLNKNPEAFNDLRDNLEKNALELMKNATKLKEIDAKVKMNKLDNEVKLKNKVSGEK